MISVMVIADVSNATSPGVSITSFIARSEPRKYSIQTQVSITRYSMGIIILPYRGWHIRGAPKQGFYGCLPGVDQELYYLVVGVHVMALLEGIEFLLGICHQLDGGRRWSLSSADMIRIIAL